MLTVKTPRGSRGGGASESWGEKKVRELFQSRQHRRGLECTVGPLPSLTPDPRPKINFRVEVPFIQIRQKLLQGQLLLLNGRGRHSSVGNRQVEDRTFLDFGVFSQGFRNSTGEAVSPFLNSNAHRPNCTLLLNGEANPRSAVKLTTGTVYRGQRATLRFIFRSPCRQRIGAGEFLIELHDLFVAGFADALDSLREGSRFRLANGVPSTRAPVLTGGSCSGFRLTGA